MAVQVFDGTVAATTVAAPLVAAQGDAVTEVIVQNDPGNSANLKVGTATSQSYLLRPGDSLSIPASDLNNVYVTAASGTVNANFQAHNAPFSAGLSPRIMITAGPAAGQPLTTLNALATFTPTVTVASGANVTWDGISLQASTVTLTGVTGVTNVNGFNAVSLYRPTITDASVITVTNAATLMIQNSPLAAGSVTLTNTFALWVIAGITRLAGGAVILGANTTINSSSNFNFNACDGTSTGSVTIGNAANGGAVSIQSHAASAFQSTAANLTLGTLTSGSLLLTSAGVITASSVGTSAWTNSTGSLTLSTTTSGTLALLGAALVTINATGVAIDLQSALAVPASGSAAAGVRIGTSGPGVYVGTGTPTFSAMNGAIYLNQAATTTTTRLFINISGAGTAGTTWTNFTSTA